MNEMNNTDNVIEVEGLCKSYKAFKLENVSFNLPKGYIMGFVGENGSGKTTTIRSVLGMSIPDSGVCRLFGKDVRKNPMARGDVGVVFDELFYPIDLNAMGVERILRMFYKNWSTQTFLHNLDRFKLPQDKPVGKFSRGMKMKLMLSAAFSHEAKLLILDEPTSGLDPVVRDELLDCLADYISDGEKSILFSSHITSDIERIADFITLIDDGKLIYSGTKDELMDKYVILKGSVSDLADRDYDRLVGMKMRRSCFEALMEREYLSELSDKVGFESATLEEILIFVARKRGIIER